MWYPNGSVREHSIYKLKPGKMVRNSREITEMGQQPVEFFEIIREVRKKDKQNQGCSDRRDRANQTGRYKQPWDAGMQLWYRSGQPALTEDNSYSILS